jgi:deazaflavin-dependent oxidoreductase (nitroreductase family)
MTVRDMVRVFNKHVLNPLMLVAAGRKYWYAGVIEHAGRRTGKKYATPVVIEKVSGGFLVPLPYGTHVDWLRNVQAMGSATIRVHGQTVDVDQPVIVDEATAAGLLSPRRQREFGRFGIKNFLKMSPQSASTR